jgi:hypothetical protein
MSSADDFMSSLDAYVDRRTGEHQSGVHTADVNTQGGSTRTDLVQALQRLIRETPRHPAELERDQQNPSHH